MFERFARAQGFMFDCDGTLLDTMTIWREVEDELIAMAGGALSDEDFIWLQASSIEDGAVMLHEKYGAGSSADEIVEYTDSRLLDFYRTQAKLFDGAGEFVRKVREQEIPCAILSASPVRYVQAGLEHCGLADEFSAIVTSENTPYTKRDVQIYEYAARKMGARIAGCWGIDDSLYAIKTMHAAGLKTLAMVGDEKAGTRDELAEHADIVFERFAELLD